MNLSRPEKMLFSLLSAALWHVDPDITFFKEATEQEWLRIYKLSARQGVQAIAYDGAMMLPEQYRPPRKIKIQFGISIDKIEKKHDLQCNTAVKLNRFFKDNGIRLMLMKGLGISRYFPVPGHRESSDLDIYLFEDCDKGNKLLAAQGIAVDTGYHKHANLFYDGVSVENHRYFLNVEYYETDRILEKELQRILREEEYEILKLDNESEILLPPVTFNAIFLARHASTHFVTEGIVLRHLCDWAKFLATYDKKFNAEYLADIFAKSKQLPVVSAFTAIAHKYLNMPVTEFSKYIFDNVKLEDLILEDTLNHKYEKLPLQESFFNIIRFKYKRFMERKWKYNITHGGGFFKEAARSAIAHIKNPKIILKLK